MNEIKKISAREILDSRGNPTVEGEVELESGVKARAAVPSGASTGTLEALEMRDNEPNRYFGKGVTRAVSNVKEKIAPAILGKSVFDQKEIDRIMIDLDGTENKSVLGANAILSVSLAVARAASEEKGVELYEYIAEKSKVQSPKSKVTMPTPMFNVLNGGLHSDSGLSIQEYKIVPKGIETFSKKLQAGSEIFHTLKKLLSSAGHSIGVGDEGGFAPRLESNSEALEFINKAIEEAGYSKGKEVSLGLDPAATNFFDENSKKYVLKPENSSFSAEALVNIYKEWIEKYNLISVEDGLGENDWEGWQEMEKKLGDKIMTIGDDLLVTNVKRLQEAIEKKACNSVLVKVNQIGTLSQTLAFVKLAQENNMKVVVSHRSGETTDDFISDLAVGVGAEFVKFGSLSRGERVAKYNRLLRIEEKLI